MKLIGGDCFTLQIRLNNNIRAAGQIRMNGSAQKDLFSVRGLRNLVFDFECDCLSAGAGGARQFPDPLQQLFARKSIGIFEFF